MLKLIYKNLIAHRRRYLWIMLELCLAVFISWDLLDKVIVNEYNRMSRPGYDIDRLVTFSFREFADAALPSDYEKRDIEEQMADVFRIVDMVRDDSRVEAATISSNSYAPERGGVRMTSIPNVRKDLNEINDGEYINTVYASFWRGTDFFKTFGLKDASGAELKELDEQPMTKSQVIVSKSIADLLFPGESPFNRSLFEKGKNDDNKDRGLIAGVVNDASYRSIYGRSPIIYEPKNNKDVERAGGVNSISCVIRLKEGVDMKAYIRDWTPKITQYRFGEVYCEAPVPYEDLRERLSRDVNNKNFISESIALFFFVNILLCMTGTFYLQTRKRSEESGVMRTFGASRGFIVREMLGEGFAMVTLTWLVGCALYWFYIHDLGLANIDFMGNNMEPVKKLIPLWYDDFNTHFAVVSLIIYAIMLLAVMLGIWLPARRISRIRPIDALRDE